MTENEAPDPDLPGRPKLVEPDPLEEGYVSSEAAGEEQPELPFEGTSEAGKDDPCAALRTFLVELDPGLAGTEFMPVEEAIERLKTQKGYIEDYMRQAAGYRQGIEELQNELTRARAAAAQKDVRDERIPAISKIVSDKIADSAKVMRIQKLLE